MNRERLAYAICTLYIEATDNGMEAVEFAKRALALVDLCSQPEGGDSTDGTPLDLERGELHADHHG